MRMIARGYSQAGQDNNELLLGARMQIVAQISGFPKPATGAVTFEGVSTLSQRLYQLAQAGLVRMFQIVQPFANLTMRENIATGAHTRITLRTLALEKSDAVRHALGGADCSPDWRATCPSRGAGVICDNFNGWGTWIRTTTDGVRDRCSTVKLFPTNAI